MAEFRKVGLFPKVPFGTDFTTEELVLGKALKGLKKKASSKLQIIQLLLRAPSPSQRELQPYLARMGLESPHGLEERLYARLLRAQLQQDRLELAG